MRLEDQIRESVDSLNIEPQPLAQVLAQGRRRRLRHRVGVAACAAAVASVAFYVIGAPPTITGRDSASIGRTHEEMPTNGSQRYLDGIAVVQRAEREPPVQLSGTTIDGSVIDVADLEGDIVVVRFWAPWCAPCRDDAAVIDDLTDQPGVKAVGVVVAEPSRSSLAAAEAELALPYESIWDQDGSVGRQLGDLEPRGLPTTLVLDRQGRVAVIAVGQIRSARVLKEQIRSLLNEPEY